MHTSINLVTSKRMWQNHWFYKNCGKYVSTLLTPCYKLVIILLTLCSKVVMSMFSKVATSMLQPWNFYMGGDITNAESYIILLSLTTSKLLLLWLLLLLFYYKVCYHYKMQNTTKNILVVWMMINLVEKCYSEYHHCSITRFVTNKMQYCGKDNDWSGGKLLRRVPLLFYYKVCYQYKVQYNKNILIHSYIVWMMIDYITN